MMTLTETKRVGEGSEVRLCCEKQSIPAMEKESSKDATIPDILSEFGRLGGDSSTLFLYRGII